MDHFNIYEMEEENSEGVTEDNKSLRWTFLARSQETLGSLKGPSWLPELYELQYPWMLSW